MRRGYLFHLDLQLLNHFWSYPFVLLALLPAYEALVAPVISGEPANAGANRVTGDVDVDDAHSAPELDLATLHAFARLRHLTDQWPTHAGEITEQEAEDTWDAVTSSPILPPPWTAELRRRLPLS